MQQKSGRDLWPPFVSIGLVLKGLAWGRVQPHVSFNNHSGYSRVRVSANDDVRRHIGNSRADISESTHPSRLLPTWPMILSNLGQPRFKSRIPMRNFLSGNESLQHDPEKHALGLDPRVGAGFWKRSCPNKKIERGDDSRKSHPALLRLRTLYPPLPPITARTVSSGPKSSAPST